MPIAFHELLFGSKSSFEHNLAERPVLGVFDALDAHARNQILEDIDRLLGNVAQGIGAANFIGLLANLELAAYALFYQFGDRALRHFVFGAIDRCFNFVSVGLSEGCKEVLAAVLGDNPDGYCHEL